MQLMTPGPTPVAARIREAMSRPMILHRSSAFEAVYGELTERLLAVFGLGDDGAAIVLPGSGTSVMESVLLSLLVPGAEVVVCTNGRFGMRWARVCHNAGWLGCGLHEVDAIWGMAVDPEKLATRLCEQTNVRTVVAVHSETSTGTISDLERIARVVRDCAPEALLIADCISSAGATPVMMEEWGVDAAVMSSQKSPGLPPGAGVVALGERALELLGQGQADVPMSMDLRWYLEAHEQGSVACTPPVAHYFGLLAWMLMVEEEGQDARFLRIALQGIALREALEAMGLTIFSASPSPSVTAVRIPDGKASRVRELLRGDHGIEIAGGQDQLKGQIVRIGHMGSVSNRDLVMFVEALASVLERMDIKGLEPAFGVARIHEQLGETETQERST